MTARSTEENAQADLLQLESDSDEVYRTPVGTYPMAMVRSLQSNMPSGGTRFPHDAGGRKLRRWNCALLQTNGHNRVHGA